jgi:hypothetical protein
MTLTRGADATVDALHRGSVCCIELTVRTLVTLGAGETAHVPVGAGE